MITVGELLKNKRLEKKLTLSQVEKTTRIRVKFLEWIENNQFDLFSSQITLKGFIKNYASYLNISDDEVMAFYRRQSEDYKIPTVAKEEISSNKFRLTPKIFTISSVCALLAMFFLFLVYQYWQYSSAPMLSISQPVDNIVVKVDEIETNGTIDPQATLTINDQLVATNEDGKFSTKIPLTPGLNTLTYKATNKFEKNTTKLRHLRLESP